MRAAHVEQRAVGQATRTVQTYVDLRDLVERVSGDQRAAAPESLGAAAAELDGHPRRSRDAVDGPAEALEAAHPDGLAAEGQDVAHRQRARGQRAGDDRAGATDVERTVDPQPYVGTDVGGGHRGQDRPEGRAQVVQSRAGAAAHHHGRRLGQPGASHLVAGAGQGRRGVREVGPGHRQHPVAYAERVEGRQVLGRLRHPGIVGCDHQQRGRDRTEAGQRRREEPFVAGYVDERDVADGCELGPAVPELDGQPAPVLLVEPVGILSGQGSDERGLAVVDVTGGGDDVHVRPRRPVVRRRPGCRPARPGR